MSVLKQPCSLCGEEALQNGYTRTLTLEEVFCYDVEEGGYSMKKTVDICEACFKKLSDQIRIRDGDFKISDF